MPRPISVASGTFRRGFSMTPAETAALSTPRKAHKAMDALLVIAAAGWRCSGFQPCMKVSGLNQCQPKRPTTAIGMIPAAVVNVVKRPTDLAPRVLSQMKVQITSAVQALDNQGLERTGKHTARSQ